MPEQARDERLGGPGPPLKLMVERQDRGIEQRRERTQQQAALGAVEAEPAAQLVEAYPDAAKLVLGAREPGREGAAGLALSLPLRLRFGRVGGRAHGAKRGQPARRRSTRRSTVSTSISISGRLAPAGRVGRKRARRRLPRSWHLEPEGLAFGAFDDYPQRVGAGDRWVEGGAELERIVEGSKSPMSKVPGPAGSCRM